MKLEDDEMFILHILLIHHDMQLIMFLQELDLMVLKKYLSNKMNLELKSYTNEIFLKDHFIIQLYSCKKEKLKFHVQIVQLPILESFL